MHNKSLKEIRHFVILLKRWRRRVIIYSELIERNISCTTIADDALPWQTNAVVVVNSERDGTAMELLNGGRQCRYVTSKYFLIIYDETNDHKHTCHVCYSHKVPMMYQYRLYGIHKRLIFLIPVSAAVAVSRKSSLWRYCCLLLLGTRNHSIHSYFVIYANICLFDC